MWLSSSLSHLLDGWWECRPLPSISSFPLSRILKPIDFQKQSGPKAKCFNSCGRNPIPAPATHRVIVHYSDLTRRPTVSSTLYSASGRFPPLSTTGRDLETRWRSEGPTPKTRPELPMRQISMGLLIQDQHSLHLLDLSFSSSNYSLTMV